MVGYITLNKEKKFFNKLKIIKPTQKEAVITISIDEKCTEKKINKVRKKLIKVLEKNYISSVVFENEIINNYEIIYNTVLSNDFKVINGNYLYEKMLNNIIEYIIKNSNIELNKLNVGIAINLLSFNRLQFIKEIAKEIKGLSIFTDVSAKFTGISNEILEDTGLCIKVSDNIKSALRNCNLIINFDFDFNKYNDIGYNNCIIINFNEKIQKVRKSFKGIIVNDVNVELKEHEILQYIDENKYRNIALEQSIDEEDTNLSINYLIGIKDVIDIKEFESFKIEKNNNRNNKKNKKAKKI